MSSDYKNLLRDWDNIVKSITGESWEEILEKSERRDLSRLTPVRKEVMRDGKPHMQTVYVLNSKDDIKRLKNTHGQDKVIELAKQHGIQWKEHDNKPINYMRAAMAMHEHIKQHGNLEIVHREAPKQVKASDFDTSKGQGKPGEARVGGILRGGVGVPDGKGNILFTFHGKYDGKSGVHTVVIREAQFKPHDTGAQSGAKDTATANDKQTAKKTEKKNKKSTSPNAKTEPKKNVKLTVPVKKKAN